MIPERAAGDIDKDLDALSSIEGSCKGADGISLIGISIGDTAGGIEEGDRRNEPTPVAIDFVLAPRHAIP